MLDLLITALYIFVGFITISHLFTFVYLYIETSLGQLTDPDQYPNPTYTDYIINCAREFIYMSGKYYLYALKYINLTLNQEKLVNNPKPTAILLIHGYLRNQGDWWWFRKQLTNLPCPIYTVNLEPAYGTIQEITEHSIAKKIAEIKTDSNCEEIILIGHSMGGLVASYYSEFLDKDNLIKKIITIGTPFHGTKLCVAAAGENAKQMYPDSKFSQELISKINISSKQYYQVLSQFDNLVFPWRSAILDNSRTTKFILPLSSHLGMLHCRKVIKQILYWLSPNSKV